MNELDTLSFWERIFFYKKEDMKEWIKRNKLNIILGLGAIAAIVLSFLISSFFARGEKGQVVVIQLHGEEYQRLDLSQDAELTIRGEKDDYNIVVIENGEVYVKDANCADHTCMHMGHISNANQIIVCLPHELIIKVEGGQSQYDAISG